VITLRKHNHRGHADHGWLQSYHTFSFAGYYEPAHIHFRQLRVFNEDFIGPSSGFPTHGHDNMEIITVVVSGVLEHKDSMGNTAQIRPGEVQVMSAGSGITHSEMNPSADEVVHLFQIWIFPKTQNTPPSYQQQEFLSASQPNQWTTYVSPDGQHNSLTINQDALLLGAKLDEGKTLAYVLAPKRHGFLHVVSGAAVINGEMIGTGDAARISEDPISITALETCQLLFFDLA